MIVEIRQDYLGWRRGNVTELGSGIADILIRRGYAKPVDPEESPPPKIEKQRAVKRAKEYR